MELSKQHSGLRAFSRVGFIVFCALILVGPALSAIGSDEQAEEARTTAFSGSVEVRLGTVTVVVRDKKGQPVTGLTSGDFVFFVDGEQRKITNFAEVREESLKTYPATDQPVDQPLNFPDSVAARAQPRLLAVVVDSENISVFNRNSLIKRARQFIEDIVRPPNLGMVLTNENYPKVLCPPTSDSQEVYAALTGLLETTSGASRHKAAIRLAEDQVFEAKGGGSFQRDSAISHVRMTARQLDDSLKRSIETLKTICRALGGFEGKKDVLFVSDGLPFIPGEELFRLLEIELGYREALTEMYGLYRAPLFEELANQAIAADVALHTIDARGLIVPGGSSADNSRPTSTSIGYVKAHNYQEPLRYLSATTGGIAIVNTNEFEKKLGEVEEAIAGYYSLGFALGERGGDKLHAIKIEVPGRTESRVLYRKQYLERSAVSLSADRTMTGLLVAPSHNNLGVEIKIGIVAPQKKKVWTAEVLIKIPSMILAARPGPGGPVADLTLFAVSASEKGRSPMSRTGHSLVLPRDGAPISILQLNLELGPGKNRISIGVLDEASGLDGFAVAETTLPD